MEDVAPGLLKAIREDFARRIAQSKQIQAVHKRIETGNATYADAQEYAALVGEALSRSFLEHFSSETLPEGRLYYNIADRVIRPMLKEDHALISDAAAAVQQSLNKKAGISIKPQRPPVNEDRVEGIVSKVSDAESFDDAAWMLEEPVVNYSQSVVDEIIRANADFHYKVGLTPKIQRTAETKACKWCRSLEGTYEYPDVPKDVYRRHERCRCVVEYDPGSGKRQNVHTKRWTTVEDRVTLETRKQTGLRTITQELAEHPMRLASFSPASLKSRLEADGYEVKPLKRGSLKDIPFEEGGGYKVNFPDGGILQYHPEKKSHHSGAYYKISTGKGGTHRYELDGTEKSD